ADSGPIFDDEPLQKVSNDDHYNVFAMESEHPEQSEYVHDTYPIDQDVHNVIIDSLDMSYDREEIDQNDDDNDLANERELLASLIRKLKCEINENKNRNKFLETSNKVLIEQLKGEIEDFKNKNKSLESSNNHFKEANNKLSETNNLLYTNYKKSEAELARCNNKLSTHQETISILSQQKEAQIKLYKTREDKKLEKVIALENKVKVLDNIVYKTGQSVQTMNMLNNKCRTSFAKPEFLKKAQRANPHLYDIGCYNDNLALMLASESDEKRMDESIPLDKKCQSSIEIFKVKTYVNTIINGVELCKEKIVNRTYSGYIDPFIQKTIEENFSLVISRINAGLEEFHRCLNEEMVADLRYFNSLELEIDSLRSQLETQKTQFLNEIDRLFREYCYADHMNAILGVYTELDKVTNLQCDYLELLEKCEGLETELSKSKMMSKSFEALQKHAINLEIDLQQYLKAQLQDKGIVISELKKLIEKLKGKYVETKFEKSSIIRQPNAFKSQRPSVLGKPTTFLNYFVRKDFSKSNSVTQNNVSNDFSKPVTAQTLPPNKKSILKNTNVLAPGMYKVHIKSNQTRTSQLPQNSRKTNKRVSFSTGVIPTTSVSTQLKSNPMRDRVIRNNSQGKNQEVEDQRRSVKFSKNKTFVTAWLNHNLFSVGQFCDADLEVAFRKSTCFIRDLKVNDLLTGSRGTNLYSITLQDINFPNPICLMANETSSQAWLWHRRLSHLNFDTINLLSKNDIVVGLPKLKFIKDHLCSSCELGKAKRKPFHTKLTPSSKRRSKDETPKVLIDFLRLIQSGLQAQVRIVRTDKGMKILNQNLHAYFAAEGIHHQTSVARTHEQNDVVERRNRTLVEAARTILSAAKVPLFFWAEAIATACFTQNRSLVIPRHEKTPYQIINNRKPSVKFFYIFGSLCCIVRDGENLDKMKEKGDECIFVGYSTQSRANRVFNKRTRVIMESIHVNFNELPQMASDHDNSNPAPKCQRMALEHASLSPAIQRQANVPQADRTVTMSNELDLLFSLMFDELPMDLLKLCLSLPLETSSRHVDSSNMHTFYQRYPSEHRWTKDHSLEQVIGNPSQSVRTRRHLESDGEMCMFALTVSQTEPKNIKEAMADSAWIESMQEEVY
nr:hypothetical protein [Tanacetum cinerariifolium]